LRGQNEAARGGQIIGFRRENLADHGGRRPAFQRFFYGPERFFRIRCMNEEEASRVDPVHGEPRSIQRTLFQTGEILADPDDRRPVSAQAQTSGKGQSETCCGGMIAGPRRNDLVQRAGIQAAGEHQIDAGVAERNALGSRQAYRIFDAGNFLAQKTQPFRALLSER
jgi:hypothetical protein